MQHNTPFFGVYTSTSPFSHNIKLPIVYLLRFFLTSMSRVSRIKKGGTDKEKHSESYIIVYIYTFGTYYTIKINNLIIQIN